MGCSSVPFLRDRPVTALPRLSLSVSFEALVQAKRNTHAAPKLRRKLLNNYAIVSEPSVADDLRSEGAGPPSESKAAMNAGDERTIGRKVRVSRPDAANARRSASRAPVPRRDSDRPTPPHSTPSTSNTLSPRLKHALALPPRQ